MKRMNYYSLLLALFAFATTAQAQFGGGSGTSVDPYRIRTTDHMTELANNVNYNPQNEMFLKN